MLSFEARMTTPKLATRPRPGGKRDPVAPYAALVWGAAAVHGAIVQSRDEPQFAVDYLTVD